MIYFPNSINRPPTIGNPTPITRRPTPAPEAPATPSPVVMPKMILPPPPEPSMAPQVPSLPSMTQMAKNIAGSIAKTAKSAITGQGIRISSEEAKRRLDICNNGPCPFFRQSDQRCSKCGCYMAVKTYLKAERCPIGKW